MPQKGIESAGALNGEKDMCEAHAFLLKGDTEEMILENVDEVYVEGQEVRLINIFGEQKILRARIKTYDNARRKIVLEELQPIGGGRKLDDGAAHSQSC
jgi:predicted RNA-binding protein